MPQATATTDPETPASAEATAGREEIDVRTYECAILYPYPLPQKEEQEILKEVENIFTEAGATQIAKDTWGRRGLAYKIAGYDEGCFVVYHYEMDPAKLKEIDHSLRIAKGVLRHLLIKPPKGYEIVKYSELYEQWLKSRETAEEVKDREKEEKLKRAVVERAKRAAKKVEAEKEAVEKVEKPVVEEEKITEEIDKLIADEDLDI